MNTISISIEARRRQHTLCMCIYSVLVGYLVLNYSNSSPIKTALYLHIFQIASRNTRTHKKVLIDFWCLLPFAFIHSYFISCLFITQIKQYLRQINQTKRNSKTVQSLLFRFFLFTSFMWKRLEKKGEQWIWHWHQKSRSIIRQFSWEKLRLINSNQSWIHFPTNKKHHCRIILLDVIRRVDRGLSFEFLCDYLETKKCVCVSILVRTVLKLTSSNNGAILFKHCSKENCLCLQFDCAQYPRLML